MRVGSPLRCALQLRFAQTRILRWAPFRPLERFLNRGSHRDETNIAHVDWGQFDIAYYLAKLEAVFQAAGHPDHYRLKMGLPEVV